MVSNLQERIQIIELEDISEVKGLTINLENILL